MPRSRILERGPGDSAVALSVLPGGLRVVTETMPASRSASIGVWVGVGSVDEAGSLAGVSHYLEHLLFKGTKARTGVQIAGSIDAVGGELNAFTAHEYTCYYAHVLAHDAATAVDVVCDVVLNARIAAADVETERSVILDEIAMRDDDPDDSLAEAFAARLFAGHPVGDPVSGTAESVAALSRRQVHGYYRRRYDPRSMVIAVAGGVAHRDVVRWVRAAFADRLDPAQGPQAVRAGAGFTDPGPSVRVVTRDIEQAHLTLGVPALPRHHPDRFALAVLSTAFGGGMSSRLFQRIREQNGLTYSCYSSTSAYADTGSWSMYAACQPANLSIVADLIRRELEAVATDGFTGDELALARGQLCGGTVLGLEDSESRMNRLGRRVLTASRYLPLDDELDAIRRVTGDEVTAMARRLLTRPATVAVSGPYSRARELPGPLRALARRPVWPARARS
ncbi:MAG: peptidase M16 [Actinobacteria bacterium 69-20]|nr:insulinase family protein [Actinomycetota bacterium]OJV30293.1 MAG: peptidase M16 [Actinobacteria bacterium 69-20]